jgi:hypothetical protein
MVSDKLVDKLQCVGIDFGEEPTGVEIGFFA